MPCVAVPSEPDVSEDILPPRAKDTYSVPAASGTSARRTGLVAETSLPIRARAPPPPPWLAALGDLPT